MDLKVLYAGLALIILLASCTLFQKASPPQPPQQVGEWATSATASDAYGGKFGGNRDDQSAFAATGEPDVANCTDSGMAWTASNQDNGIQTLELGYDQQIYVSGVRVRENFGPGAVTKVEVQNVDDGSYKTLWEGKDKTRQCPAFFDVNYQLTEGNITRTMTPYLSDKVRLTIDTDVKGWNEIDAVELLGYNQKWYMYNQTLFLENETN